ncbi:MAG: electron transport complex subunit RsxG [Zoogloeaceae bacterium]|jgi:electron transport complex protein RnfG|nr:electron transport complex subunit RsxG [Zoogloeaceae bacterium]
MNAPLPETGSAAVGALKMAGVLLAFTLIFTGLLALAEKWSRPAIEASQAAEKMKLINEVLPARRYLYDNDLLTDTLLLPPAPELGLDAPSLVYRARREGQPVALVLEAVAPDGYAAEIRLIFGITRQGTITGVRVVAHKETPGLGDYIDLKKDKDKKYPWILQFNDLNYPGVPDREWQVRKDRGRFYYRTGATISPRAVIRAVHRAAQFAAAQSERLFAASDSALLDTVTQDE